MSENTIDQILDAFVTSSCDQKRPIYGSKPPLCEVSEYFFHHWTSHSNVWLHWMLDNSSAFHVFRAMIWWNSCFRDFYKCHGVEIELRTFQIYISDGSRCGRWVVVSCMSCKTTQHRWFSYSGFSFIFNFITWVIFFFLSSKSILLMKNKKQKTGVFESKGLFLSWTFSMYVLVEVKMKPGQTWFTQLRGCNSCDFLWLEIQFVFFTIIRLEFLCFIY